MLVAMNQLSLARRVQIAKCLVEGMSLRSTSRLCGAAINTVMNFAKDLGETCEKYQREVFKDLDCKRIQCDEIWSFVGRKEKRVTPELKEIGEGDAWVWTAIDADTRLVPSWHVGLRDAESAKIFITDLASRLKSRVQLSSDGYKSYLTAVEDVFGEDIDFGMLVKIYGDSEHDTAPRQSRSPWARFRPKASSAASPTSALPTATRNITASTAASSARPSRRGIGIGTIS